MEENECLDDFEDSTSGLDDSKHWRNVLAGVDKETMRELSTAGQALVATVNSPYKSLVSSSSSSFFLDYFGQGTTSKAAHSVGPTANSVLSSMFEITKFDFKAYLQNNGEALADFQKARERRNSLEHDRSRWTQGQGLVESMKHVPPMYFRENFFLGDLETYKSVLASLSSPTALSNESEETWKEVVAQISSYVDVVEINLLREIEARASQFFEAMDIIQDLQQCISQACLSISITRRGLNKHGQVTESAMGKMQQLQAEKAALESLLEMATDLDTTHHANTALKMLLSTFDYAGILDVMNSLEHALQTSKVGDLKCFRGNEERISKTRVELIESMTRDFVRLAKTVSQPLGQFRTRQSQSTSLPVPAAASPAASQEDENRQPLSEMMLPVVLSLHRTGSLADAIKTFFDYMEQELKTTMSTFVANLAKKALSKSTGNNDDDDREESSNLNEEEVLRGLLQILSLAEFLDVQESMVTSIKMWISNTLGDLKHSLELILKDSFFVYSQEFLSLEQYLQEILAGFWAKIIGMRYAANQSYKLHEYLSLVHGTRQALGDDELQKGSNHYNVVRNVLNNQSKSYLDVLHKYCKTKLTSALEQDQWKTSPVSQYVQDLVKGFETCDENGEQEEGGAKGSRLRSDSGSKTVDYVELRGERFYLVPSAVVFVQTVSDLLSYSSKLPQLTTEVTHRMIELFKIYNALSCNLILGAGAMKSAGLKSISARHLGAIAQTVYFMQCILPLIVENLTSRLLPLHQNILMPQFRKVANDLEEHHSRIEKKLIKIMVDRLETNLGVLGSIAQTWDENGKEEEEEGNASGKEISPSQVCSQVCKQLDTLSTALSRLDKSSKVSIFTQIADLYSAKTKERFAELATTARRKRQLQTDADAIQQKLQSLTNI